MCALKRRIFKSSIVIQPPFRLATRTARLLWIRPPNAILTGYQGKRMKQRFIPVLIALLIAGCSSSEMTTDRRTNSVIQQPVATGARVDVESSSYVIQRGDQVQLSVWGYPEFNTTAPVKETGAISVPLIGDLPAAGITRSQLMDEIIAKLSDYVKSKVYPTITIIGALAQKVIVLGSVTGQGSYTIAAPVSPFQVLAAAGGPAPNADLRHIKIFHNGDSSPPIEVDLSGYVANITQNKEDIPLVNPGDMIYVPKEENVIREFADLLRDVILLFGIFAVVR